VRFQPTRLLGVIVVEPDVFRDDRGFFFETYHIEKYKAGGIFTPFVQDNQSSSVYGTVRGLHLQVGSKLQGKLVRAIEGEIFDVAADVRRGSPTFGQWVGVTLSANNFKQCYVPPGFAHGFAVVSETAQVEYKCTDFYDAGSELGIAWDDPELAIDWPAGQPVLSERDRKNPRLSAIRDRLPIFRPTAR
jgi:dTDP-4-dehydrorhamnose 3,5-epimerase